MIYRLLQFEFLEQYHLVLCLWNLNEGNDKIKKWYFMLLFVIDCEANLCGLIYGRCEDIGKNFV